MFLLSFQGLSKVKDLQRADKEGKEVNLATVPQGQFSELFLLVVRVHGEWEECPPGSRGGGGLGVSEIIIEDGRNVVRQNTRQSDEVEQFVVLQETDEAGDFRLVNGVHLVDSCGESLEIINQRSW